MSTLKHLVTHLIAVLFIILFLASATGCIAGGKTQPTTVTGSDPFTNYAPDPTARIIEYGKAAIKGADDRLPDIAAVLLGELPLEENESGVKYSVGVKPKGYQPVWVGTLEADGKDFDRLSSLPFGIVPNFETERSDSSDERRLVWLSRKPALLLATASDYMQGSGCWENRYDTIVLYENGRPSILLQDELTTHGSWGQAGFCHLWSTRKVIYRSRRRATEITFTDQMGRQDVCLDVSEPLYRRFWYEGHEDGKDFKMWYGRVETERTRIWSFTNGKLVLKKEVLKYLVQPEDTWEDIAEGFLGDKKYASLIRETNSGTGRPVAKEWIDIPSRPTE